MAMHGWLSKWSEQSVYPRKHIGLSGDNVWIILDITTLIYSYNNSCSRIQFVSVGDEKQCIDS